MTESTATSPGLKPSLSIAGLHASAVAGPWANGARAAVGWASGLGFRLIHLDATAPDTRARTLDRSARRDLAATVRRAGLGFTGLDLWIPAEHFGTGEHADRAHAALLGAIELAADLGNLVRSGGSVAGASGRPAVSVNLPEAYAGADEVSARADVLGVFVEDFGAAAERYFSGMRSESGRQTEAAAGGGASEIGPASAIRPGVDTARLILRGRPPGKSFAKLSGSVATLRLNDADDTGRRVMGSGRLEIQMLIALHATLSPGAPIVADLRGIENPAHGAQAALSTITPLGGFLEM